MNRFAVRSTLLMSALYTQPHIAFARPVSWLDVMGEGSERVLAPSTGLASIVFKPEGGRDLPPGATPLWGGYAIWRGTRDQAAALSWPPNAQVLGSLHPTMNVARGVIRTSTAHNAGLTGKGVIMGVVDSGLDLKHRDFLDAKGKSRVKWMLDYGQAPLGTHADLEAKYAVVTANGQKVGAVLSSEELSAWLLNGPPEGRALPIDSGGHGTHVMGIAAGSMVPGEDYAGVAPDADLVVVRASFLGAAESEFIARGTAFAFDRAEAAGQPAVVNLSLSDDVGPHDGTSALEGMLASLVGSAHPGHSIVVAAGNSAQPSLGIHQRVHVPAGTTMRVPYLQTRDIKAGTTQIYVVPRTPGSITIGLEGPSGLQVGPVSVGRSGVQKIGSMQAGIVYARTGTSSKIPEGSNAAWIAWTGPAAAGTYNIVLDGIGQVDLYGDSLASSPQGTFGGFSRGVREGTVGSPATHADMIAVGCTTLRLGWNNVLGRPVKAEASRTDDEGGIVLGIDPTLQSSLGQICSFSGAGPTLAGIPRPDIAAPGFGVFSAMSADADPRSGQGSALSDSSCLGGPLSTAEAAACSVIDDTHAVLSGTSMSSPMVAGAVALLLQAEPTLTQQRIRSLLQAGAHAFRGSAPFFAQSGPGELDVEGALAALARSKSPSETLPIAANSWMRPSDDHIDASGKSPLTLFVELRTHDGSAADLFDLTRLQVLVDDAQGTRACAAERMEAGLWRCVYTAPTSESGTVSFSVTLDGKELLGPLRLRSATDPWTSRYASKFISSCSASAASRVSSLPLFAGIILAARVLCSRIRSRKS